VLPPALDVSVEDWWNNSLRGRSKDEARKVAALLIHTTWNIWKERNRRVFDGVALAAPSILFLIKEEMRLRELACGRGELYVVIQ
jgi:hypothetical protein